MLRSLRVPRLRRLPRFVLAGTCLALALISGLTAAPATAPAAGPSAPVVVAVRDLPPGRVLVVHDLAVRRWPVALRPHGAATTVATLVGRRLAVALTSGDAVTRARLLGRDLTTGMPRSMLAVPVALADAHVGELVRPGDRVDVLSTPPADPIADTGSRPVASAGLVTVVASAVRVLAVLPRSDDTGTEIVVAADRRTTLRLTASAAQPLAAVAIPP